MPVPKSKSTRKPVFANQRTHMSLPRLIFSRQFSQAPRKSTRYDLSELKSPGVVATFTISKIVRAKSSVSVMATRAALRSCGSKMHRGQRGRHLSSAGHSRPHRMTACTVQILISRVFCMTKTFPKSRRPFRSPNKPSRLVTNIARRHRT